jgi:hypothetical protein
MSFQTGRLVAGGVPLVGDRRPTGPVGSVETKSNAICKCYNITEYLVNSPVAAVVHLHSAHWVRSEQPAIS